MQARRLGNLKSCLCAARITAFERCIVYALHACYGDRGTKLEPHGIFSWVASTGVGGMT